MSGFDGRWVMESELAINIDFGDSLSLYQASEALDGLKNIGLLARWW